MECARLKLSLFWNKRDKFYRLELDCGYTCNRYSFWVSLLGKLEKEEEKREPHIGDMEIPLSRSNRSITPNARIIQLSNISYGGTHQIYS